MSIIGIKRKLKKKLLLEEPYSKEPSNECEWYLMPPTSNVKFFRANHKLATAQMDLIVRRMVAERNTFYDQNIIAELDREKHELQQQFVKADVTLAQSRASVYRFNEKYKEQLIAQLSLLDQIYATKQELIKYPKVSDQMEHYVREYSLRYKLFLETVAQNSTEFNSVQDILNHFEMLETIQKECNQSLQKEMDTILLLRKEVKVIVEVKANRLKILNNRLAALEMRKEKAKQSRIHWRNVTRRIQFLLANDARETIAIQLACNDFYVEMCKQRKKKPILQREDVNGQLDFIRKTIFFYREVLGIAAALNLQRLTEEQEVESEEAPKHELRKSPTPQEGSNLSTQGSFTSRTQSRLNLIPKISLGAQSITSTVSNATQISLNEKPTSILKMRTKASITPKEERTTSMLKVKNQASFYIQPTPSVVRKKTLPSLSLQPINE